MIGQYSSAIAAPVDELWDNFDVWRIVAKSLDQRSAEVLRMRCVDEMTYERIGVSIGRSTGTARVIAEQAMGRLRHALRHMATTTEPNPVRTRCEPLLEEARKSRADRVSAWSRVASFREDAAAKEAMRRELEGGARWPRALDLIDGIAKLEAREASVVAHLAGVM